MTPDEFLARLQTREPPAACLFIGPEGYSRDRCRAALIARVLPPEDRETGVIRHDLSESELAAVIDDAQSFSLFASQRVIWASSAEAALPRGRIAASADEDGETSGKDGGASVLASYLKNPAQGTTLVFDCSRYELDGEDRARVQRVQKFFAGIREQVECARYTPDMARRLASQLAKEKSLKIGSAELDLLAEVLAGDAQQIANEIEKLSLYAGTDKTVREEDIRNLTPNAKASTIFALVNAVARRDRAAALESLDVLVREGEYLPLALSFLSTQFRLAMVAKESRLTGVSQIQNFFSKQGTPMWKSRAEQVAQTASAFSLEKLRKALSGIYNTDKALRDNRPDDRIIMERFVLELTGR